METKILVENLKLFAVLRDDVAECHRQARTTGNQFWRRMYVRAFFAEIEASVYQFKQMAFHVKFEGKPELSRAEQAILLEEAYDVTENGKSKVKPSWFNTERNVRFAFATVIRVFGLATAIDYAGEGWCSLNKAVDIRHRLTHPKDVRCAFVSNDEMNLFEAAGLWFRNNAVRLLREMADSLEKRQFIDESE